MDLRVDYFARRFIEVRTFLVTRTHEKVFAQQVDRVSSKRGLASNMHARVYRLRLEAYMIGMANICPLSVILNRTEFDH